MNGIDAIMSRMAEISALVAPQATSTTSTNATSDADFSATLGQALGDADTAGDATGSTGSTTGTDVVNDAKKYLGVPYVWGGTNPSTGLDCSGLVQRVYADLGITLPRVSRDQATVGTAVSSLDQAKPGDLLAFGSPVHHIGIYLGNGQMIHAPEPGQNVKIGKVYETPTAIRRVVPDSTTGSNQSIVDSMGSLSALTSKYSTSGDSSAYANLFAQATAKYGLPSGLLSAVAKQESNYNPNAVSGAGAQGLMQLMPSTASSLGVNAFDPAQAVDGAARLLKSNLQSFGSVPLALAAYNAGPGAVRKYDGVPPYTETQNYVKKIMANLTAEAAA
ncbi:transglycosylase SLT domain-containing protein [Actinokineospora inagensis]|uniref:transglycosylase SLT domain-containing protein n=1 Tax=Actinokineospora inagensis TaxID=103730 RepID=UPI0003FED287|nr:transglycosylase SLT domain-containing protein [Actinokineospora inagensis]